MPEVSLTTYMQANACYIVRNWKEKNSASFRWKYSGDVRKYLDAMADHISGCLQVSFGDVEQAFADFGIYEKLGVN